MARFNEREDDDDVPWLSIIMLTVTVIVLAAYQGYCEIDEYFNGEVDTAVVDTTPKTYSLVETDVMIESKRM